jgi:hypothetical protein
MLKSYIHDDAPFYEAMRAMNITAKCRMEPHATDPDKRKYLMKAEPAKISHTADKLRG